MKSFVCAHHLQLDTAAVQRVKSINDSLLTVRTKHRSGRLRHITEERATSEHWSRAAPKCVFYRSVDMLEGHRPTISTQPKSADVADHSTATQTETAAHSGRARMILAETNTITAHSQSAKRKGKSAQQSEHKGTLSSSSAFALSAETRVEHKTQKDGDIERAECIATLALSQSTATMTNANVHSANGDSDFDGSDSSTQTMVNASELATKRQIARKVHRRGAFYGC